MRRSLPRAVLAFSLVAFAPALLAPAVLAQEQGRFGEELSVRLVEVPVQVSLDGRAVPGLTQENFQVFEGKTPRPIVGFDVYDASAASAEEIGMPLARNFLLVFDLAFGNRRDLAYALEGARRWAAAGLPAGDRLGVALVSLSGGWLVAPLSTDRQAFHLALDSVEAVLDSKPKEIRARQERLIAHLTARANADPSSQRLAQREALGAAGALVLASVATQSSTASGQTAPSSTEAQDVANLDMLRDEGVSLNPLLSQIAAAGPTDLMAANGRNAATSVYRTYAYVLGDVATWLTAVDGAKHVLLLSGGFDEAALEDVKSANHLNGLIEAVRRAGWSFEAIDIERQAGGFESGGLSFLAVETGGRLYQNVKTFEDAAARLVADTAVTYFLAVEAPAQEPNGRFHPLEVRLVGGPAGAKVRHRPGYYAPKKARERTPLERQLEEAQQLVGEEAANGLPARVWTAAFRATGNLSVAPVVVELPAAAFPKKLEETAIEVEVYAFDDTLGVVDSFRQKLEIDPARHAAALRGQGARLFGDLLLPPGEYRLRLRVRSGDGEKLFLGTVPLAVPAGEAAPPLAAMVLDARGGWLLLREKGYPVAGTNPLQVAERPLVPTLEPKVARGTDLAVCLFSYDLGPGASLQGRLRRNQGEPTAATWKNLARTPPDPNGLSHLLAQLDTTALPPGQYELTLAMGAGNEAATVVSFEVVAAGG